jgi:hypothetical protein
MTCATCRHASKASPETVREALTRGTVDGTPMRITDTDERRILESARWVLCHTHETLIPASETCPDHASAIVAKLRDLVGLRVNDTVLYRTRRLEREVERAKSIREHARKTAEAEAKVRTTPCSSCGFLHDRCATCDLAIGPCALCSCGGGVKNYRRHGAPASEGVWQCSICEKPAAAPAARMTWDAAKCDGCRAFATIKSGV